MRVSETTFVETRIQQICARAAVERVHRRSGVTSRAAVLQIHYHQLRLLDGINRLQTNVREALGSPVRSRTVPARTNICDHDRRTRRTLGNGSPDIFTCAVTPVLYIHHA
jgi:hypothetical protein